MKRTLVLFCFLTTLFFANAQLSNYTFSATVGSFNELSGANPLTSIQGDDISSAKMPIGFTFNFRGVDYTEFIANSNGWITFDTSSNPSAFDQQNNDLENNTTQRPIVAPLWDDLDGTTGVASYKTEGVSPNRVLIMEWKNWEWNASADSATISFQVKLYEGFNHIEFVYRPENKSAVINGSASIGITDTTSGVNHFLSIDSLTTTAKASSLVEKTDINNKPVIGLTFRFLRCNAFLANIGNLCTNSPQIILNQGTGLPAGGMGTYYLNNIPQTTLNPTSLSKGTHTILYEYRDGNCIDSVKQLVIVDSVTPVSFTIQNSICTNVDTVRLNGLPTGGIYNGSGLIPNTNKIVPSMAGMAGTKQVSYLFTNLLNCSDSIVLSYQLDTISPSSIAMTNKICENANSVNLLPTGSPLGGVFYGTKINTNSYQPTNSGTDTLFYLYQTANGCADTSSKIITVDAAPIINFGNIANLCENSRAIMLNTATPLGGIYKGKGVNGLFYTPSVAGVDTILYVFENSNNCKDSSTQTIVVDSITKTSLINHGPFCENSPTLTLSGGLPIGGTYMGKGVLGPDYSPVLAGAGFDSLFYVYTNTLNCTDTSMQIVTINAAPTVTFNKNLSLCEQDPEFQLTGGLPINGVYSGKGVNSSTGTIDAMAVGVNTSSIVYTFTNGLNCVDSASIMVSIYENPVFSLGDDIEICGTETVELDPGIDSANYAWNTGENTRKITVQESKIYTVIVTDTSNGCSSEDEIRVEYDAICLNVSELLKQQTSVTYFPNPVANKLSIKINNIESQPIKLEFITINGVTVLSKRFNYTKGDVLEIDLGHYPKGNYFFALTTKEGMIKRLISKY